MGVIVACRRTLSWMKRVAGVGALAQHLREEEDIVAGKIPGIEVSLSVDTSRSMSVMSARVANCCFGAGWCLLKFRQ